MAPNIFTYATSELSQDAFICWLVACARDDGDSLRKCGTEFIRTLWNHGRGTTSGKTCSITDVFEPQRQRGKSKIDVYFEARVDGDLVGFAIEDKTNTQMHGEQLPRQKGEIDDDKRLDDNRLIYYKTGYVFEDERQEAEKAGFAVFAAQDMLDFLNSVPAQVDREILRQYREYLTTLVDYRKLKVTELDMTHDFVQSEFMRMLRNRLVENMGCWVGFLNETTRHPEDQHRVTRDQNKRGGGPWTQYWFCNHLFWRLDADQRLRLRVWTSEAAIALGDGWDTDVWGRWIETFSLVQKEIQLPAMNFNWLMHRGDGLVDEGTVGAIDIKNAFGGNLETTLDKIIELHCAFLQRIT